MRALDISTKETYLAWVEEWKAEWKELAATIREHKRAKRQNRNRARKARPNPKWEGRPDEYNAARDAMFDHHWSAFRLRWKAAQMIVVRHDGKRLSWAKKMEAAQELVAAEKVS